MDLGVLSQGLDGWTDLRTIARGFGYVEKVKELAATDDLLAGVVDGTTRYFTNVRIAGCGELEAVCTCPVGKRCKHAVALILKVWRMMNAQEEIPSTIAEEWVKAVERKQEENRCYQRLAVEQREAQRAYEEKCERECEDAFRRDFNAVREVVFASCREDSVEKIKATVVKFLKREEDDELHSYPHICQEVVRYLIKHQMYDKAIEIAREGVKSSRMSGEYGNDYYVELQDPLADAFSGKGDHLKASAILAEAFLDRIGAYDEKRTVAQFNRILEEAEKAGVREGVRMALIYVLETGFNPSSIVTYKFHPCVQEFDWKPVPKPVVYQIKTTCPEAPPWPLPWANEGIRLVDSRWQDDRGCCQQDMEFLLKLALADGDRAEIARRFDDLPETPNAGGFPLEGAKAEMCESVMAAMKDFRDDIVARLARVRKYCYVTKEEGGLKSAVRVIKRLGEAAHSTYDHTGTVPADHSCGT